MSSSCKESDDTVVGGRGGTGIVADTEDGVCRFSVGPAFRHSSPSF